jgi:hypothetical protein
MDIDVWRELDILEGIEPVGDAGPVITIGYLPPGKRNDCLYRIDKILRGKAVENLTVEDLLENDRISRDVVAWGVRGHKIAGLDFVSATREYAGKQWQGCADSIVDIYEINGWLGLIKNLVLEYNTISLAKKKKL